MIIGVRPSVGHSFVVAVAARCPKTLVDLPLALALITAGLGATKALFVVQKVKYFKNMDKMFIAMRLSGECSVYVATRCDLGAQNAYVHL